MTSKIASQSPRLVFVVPLSRRHSTAAILMPDMSASAEASTLYQEEDFEVVQWKSTPDAVTVADTACPCCTGSRLSPLLSDQVTDVDSYEY